MDLDAWEAEYRHHEGAVRSYFAGRPDDLLVLDVAAGQGWEPLCEFLGHEVPEAPFPWSNRFRPGFDTLPRPGRGGGEMSGPPADRKFFFIHVMKTAGGPCAGRSWPTSSASEVYPL